MCDLNYYLRLISRRGKRDGSGGGVLDLLNWCGKRGVLEVSLDEARRFWENPRQPYDDKQGIGAENTGDEAIMIGIGLNVRGSVQAAELYQRAFGMELGYHVFNDDGTYFHSELKKDGQPMLSVVEARPGARFDGNPVQLGFTFDSKDEMLAAFELLKDGGAVLMDVCELAWSPCAAEVTDRYGVNWYLTLEQHRPDDSFELKEYNKDM